MYQKEVKVKHILGTYPKLGQRKLYNTIEEEKKTTVPAKIYQARKIKNKKETKH